MERILEIGCSYHIFNRGTNKQEIFHDEKDYYRFIHYLYVCNDTASMEKVEADTIIGGPTSGNSHIRERLVDIVCFAMMPNNFHLMLNQKKEKGISKFMQKLCTGYTMYYNNRYKRTGVLFQGKYKSIPILDEQYLPTLVRYIHLNPLELKFFKTKSEEDLISYLKDYKWSSCPDYLGQQNFPSVLSTDLFADIFEDYDEHQEFLLENASDELLEADKKLLIDSDE